MNDKIKRRNEALDALGVIRQYALDFLINPNSRNEVSTVDTLSAGISDLINHDVDAAHEIAANLVEDVNYHRMAAVIRKWDESTVEELVEIMS